MTTKHMLQLLDTAWAQTGFGQGPPRHPMPIGVLRHQQHNGELKPSTPPPPSLNGAGTTVEPACVTHKGLTMTAVIPHQFVIIIVSIGLHPHWLSIR